MRCGNIDVSLCFVVLDETGVESDRDRKGNDRYLDTHENETQIDLGRGITAQRKA